MDRYLETNRTHWDAVTRIHLAKGAGADRLRQGGTTLDAIEREELSPLLPGKSLVHLQCHVGVDTLSMLQLGARSVVGVDFSRPSIEAARALASELRAPAEFVECNVYDAARTLGRTFDIVFTSYGALCWLPDIERWADNAAALVAPGGLLYLLEFHPFLWAMADESPADRPVMGFPYLSHRTPNHWPSGTDYVDETKSTPEHYTWNHGLGAIVTSLLRRGLRLEFLHEFPYSAGKIVPAMTRRADGYYTLGDSTAYPLSYSLLARRPGP